MSFFFLIFNFFPSPPFICSYLSFYLFFFLFDILSLFLFSSLNFFSFISVVCFFLFIHFHHPSFSLFFILLFSFSALSFFPFHLLKVFPLILLHHFFPFLLFLIFFFSSLLSVSCFVFVACGLSFDHFAVSWLVRKFLLVLMCPEPKERRISEDFKKRFKSCDHTNECGMFMACLFVF